MKWCGLALVSLLLLLCKNIESVVRVGDFTAVIGSLSIVRLSLSLPSKHPASLVFILY